MKNNTDKKIEGAGSITKDAIVQKIKSENAERYDQMLIDSDVIRNDVYYINFKATYVDLLPKQLVFAMVPKVKNYFDTNCIGGSSQYGEVAVVKKDFIQSINDSDCNNSSNSYKSEYSANKFKKRQSYLTLKKGLISAQIPTENESTEKKTSVIGNLKNATSSISNTISSTSEKLSESLSRLDNNSEQNSSEYVSLKLKYFSELQYKYNGNTINTVQDTYFIPDLTSSETCNDCSGEKYVPCKKCDARHEYTCPSCNGSKEIDCPSCKGGQVTCGICNGKGTYMDKKCTTCYGKGYKTCSKCNGRTLVKCSNAGNSSSLLGRAVDAGISKEFCDGKGTIICKICYGDTERYGKVDCKPCRATGEIGKIVYIEVEVGNTSGEFYKYTNETIEQIEKEPQVLFKYLNKSNVIPTTVYSDINGSINETYDVNAEEFCKNIEADANLAKGDDYPRIITEDVFYDIVPLSTLDYNHILSGTMHKVSASPIESSFDILFHSNPTAIQKFDILNVFRVIGWNFKKAFAAKSYRDKIDKKHEIFLLVRVAKADGEIEDSEKRVLVDLIKHLNDFSNKEKAQLFNLFIGKELPPLKKEETIFSTKERADTVMVNLNKMMKEDGEVEKPEVKLIAEFKEKIYANVGKHPGVLVSFLKTWQINIPILLLIAGIVCYFMFFTNSTSTESPDANTNNVSDSVSTVQPENSINENIPPIENTPVVNQVTTTEEAVVTENGYSNYIGEWKGAFGNTTILINIEAINEDNSVTGFNVVKNNRRDLTGYKNDSDEFVLSEPGDDEWDGVFNFRIEGNKAIGSWTANNGKSNKQFTLTK